MTNLAKEGPGVGSGTSYKKKFTADSGGAHDGEMTTGVSTIVTPVTGIGSGTQRAKANPSEKAPDGHTIR